MQILTDDYSKAAFLCGDRSVQLHARYGLHYSTRIPRFGRDLAYEEVASELGTSPAAARVRVHRALAALRTRLAHTTEQGT